MPRLFQTLLLAACMGLGACQTLSVEDREDLLAEAGFTQKLADTPEKIAKMRTLAPNKFTRVVQNGRLVYVYSDPNVCNCVFLGYEDSFERYRRLILARSDGNEEQMMAIMDHDSSMDVALWGWGRGY
jgi:hypothetical protein